MSYGSAEADLHERVCELEDENAKLREQLEAYTKRRRDPYGNVLSHRDPPVDPPPEEHKE